MYIRDIVNSICCKYDTRDPFELADCLGIRINYCELGSIRGFFVLKNRIKQVFLNYNLSDYEKRFVLAHEIGHSLLHPEQNTMFLQNTFFSANRLEIEANRFAIELLMSDEDIQEHWEYTLNEWSMFYGLPPEIIELRFKK